jgi:hypothetical protein
MNKQLIERLAVKLSRIRHEEHYNQSVWAKQTKCGTAACIAGHAAIEAGWEPIDKAHYGFHIDEACKSGKWGDISEVARKALRLTETQAFILFDHDGSHWPEPFNQRFSKALRKLPWKPANSKRKARIERPSRVAAALLRAVLKGEVKLKNV